MQGIRTTIIVALALVLALTAVGCAPAQEETPAPAPEEAVVEKASAEDTAVEESKRTIEHAMGVTEIEGTPKRVVTLYQGATDVAIAMGVKPVGIVESWVQKPIYKYLREDLEGIQLVGLETQPNLEEIAKLKPDLIIASKIRHEKIYDQLSAIAPTVTHETVFKFKETVSLMGDALNKQELASQMLADWDARVADFKGQVDEVFGDEWPIEVSVLNFRSDHARIYVTGFAGDILAELGFVRSEVQQEAADQGKVVVKLTSKESIPSMDGDVFFTFIGDGHTPDAEAIQKTFDEWTGHPLWANLRAVQNEKDYMVDEVAWNMAGGYIAANDMLDQIYERFGLKTEQ